MTSGVQIALFIVVGVLIDWALFERLMTSGEVLWSADPGYRYRDTLFPRIIVTIASCATMGSVASAKAGGDAVFVISALVFAASTAYAVVTTTLRGKRAYEKE